MKNQSLYTLPLPLLLGILLLTPIILYFFTRPLFPTQDKSAPPISIITPSAVPSLVQDNNNYTKLLDKLQHKQPLSASDQKVKERIITYSSNHNSGPVYRTPLFSIDYINSTDHFQIEILTTNVDQAKGDAYNWFISQGMSAQGICNLPVQFYLNNNVNDNQSGTPFNPLPDSC